MLLARRAYTDDGRMNSATLLTTDSLFGRASEPPQSSDEAEHKIPILEDTTETPFGENKNSLMGSSWSDESLGYGTIKLEPRNPPRV